MAQKSLRGIRLGSQSLQSDIGVELSERKRCVYTCVSCGHDVALVFSADAEAPPTWPCPVCSADARLTDSNGAFVALPDAPEEKPVRTHFDMLLERRSREELEVLLEDRLLYLRSRRGQEKLGA